MNSVIDTIKKRRSVRSFEAKQIEESELQLILECAMNAPSGRNLQPWHFTVIQNAGLIKYLNDTAKEQLKDSHIESFSKFGNNPKFDLTFGAPTVIIVSGNKDAYSPIADCSAAIQNMLLAAKSLGIGSLWMGLINDAFKVDEAKTRINIPQSYEPYYGVALGYKTSNTVPKDKKINKDVVDYIR